MSNSVTSVQDFRVWIEHQALNNNYDEIVKAFQNPSTFRGLWANVAEGKSLFRCRKHREEEKDTLFQNANNIGYRRDEENIKDFGRCNAPQQSLSYLSENPYTSLMETLQHAKEGEVYTVTVGRWEVQKTLDVLYVVQPIKEKRVHAYEHLLGDRYDNHVEEMKKQYPDYEEFSRLYFDFLDSKFKSTERGKQYLITAAYANMCFAVNGDVKSYGIIYASVTHTDYFNVAFPKEVEDSKLLVLKEVVKQTVKIKSGPPKSEKDFELVSEVVAKRVSDDGSIEW